MASALTSSLVLAQLSVEVVAAPAHPLQNAHVELWSPTARLSAQVTGTEGRVRFSSSDMRAASAVLVRFIGYRPERVLVAAGAVTLRVQLEALPAPLPSITVSDAETWCPKADAPEARSRWERARSQYTAPSSFGRRSTMETFSGTTRAEELGDASRMRLATGSRGFTKLGMEGARRSLFARGYAYPLVGSHTSTEFGVWAYPALTREYAEHFAEAVFGERHNFSAVSVGPDSLEAVLAFCARDRRHTGLDGILRISEDGSFLSARWRFYNPASGAELAGGDVVFAPRDLYSDSPALLSAQGLFWRRVSSGMFFQRWEQYARWVLTDSAQP